MLARLAICLVAVAPAAWAAEPANPPSETEAREICKSTVVTGSRFKKKVCKTQAEWDAEEQAAQEYMKDADRRREKFQPPKPDQRG